MCAQKPANPENSLLTDLYQLTMCAAYFSSKRTELATFDLFVRELPKERAFLIACGLEQAVDYLLNFRFSDADLEYLRSTKKFSEDFLAFLKNLRFTGDVYAVPEGTPVFAREPILRITAPLPEAQIIETFLLNTIGCETLFASKAARVVNSARGKMCVEFGLRRAHGSDAGMKAARASHISGFAGTSNVLAGKEFGIPIYGTVAHSFILSYADEISAFKDYARVFPSECLLLIDTYDTLEGARNAARVGVELEKKGFAFKGVRIDSGNLVELSKEVRKILDNAGLTHSKIFASGDLDEYKIEKMLEEGACIDAFGVGTNLVTSSDAPSLNCNYKLSEIADSSGANKPVLKLSSGKATLPGKKQVYRISREEKFLKDVIALEEETIDGEPLLIKLIENGKLAGKLPSLEEIRARVRVQMSSLPESLKTLRKASAYKVELSKKLSELVKSETEKHK
ncbi:MAG: nicotinate phosphoribosyltransferase [Candidatus Micrarchaeota archaeon]